jgi:hypothetical protein
MAIGKMAIVALLVESFAYFAVVLPTVFLVKTDIKYL